MPLRHMVGDAFSYMKEYDEIAAVNKKNGDFHSADEFLSGFKRLFLIVSNLYIEQVLYKPSNLNQYLTRYLVV